MSERIKKGCTVLFVILMCLPLCSFIWANSGYAIDTEKNHVYSYMTAKDLTAQVNADERSAYSYYDDRYLLLSGEFEQIKPNNGFTILVGDGNYTSVQCQIKTNTSIDLNKYGFRDKIAVYGKCNIDTVFHKVSLTEVEKIISVPSVKSPDTYFTLDGTNMDRTSSLQRTLHGGRIKYYIPSYWEKVEADIQGNGLGNIEGYQYVLNRSNGSKDTIPESLFVCYFDCKTQLTDRPDIDLFNKKNIEKLIIRNINGDASSLSDKTINTYYGAVYDYYLCRYSDPINLDGYRTEYIFQQYGNEGLVMYMYLYREPKHISDIILVTRLLEQ